MRRTPQADGAARSFGFGKNKAKKTNKKKKKTKKKKNNKKTPHPPATLIP